MCTDVLCTITKRRSCLPLRACLRIFCSDVHVVGFSRGLLVRVAGFCSSDVLKWGRGGFPGCDKWWWLFWFWVKFFGLWVKGWAASFWS